MNSILRGSILLSALAASSSAFAQVAYSNFGAGDSYVLTQGRDISPLAQLQPAMKFTSAESGYVSEIRFASKWEFGSGDLTVSLRNDVAGTVGSVVGSWDVTKLNTVPSITSILNSDTGVVISSGSTYWLDIAGTSDGEHLWNLQNLGLFETAANSADGGATWTYQSSQDMTVFEVSVAPVPEPASMIALGLGAVAIVRRRRRKSA